MGNRYRIADILLILITIIVLCSLTAYVSYKKGQQQGYKTGQSANHSQGYQEGYATGYESGLEEVQGYTLINPTYNEMKEFLARDATDSREFHEDDFTCTDFSAAVNNNAEAAGFRCAVVYINYPEVGHTIVAFETSDRGIKYIEPQYDDEVILQEGKSYSQINKYTPPPEDDTIERYIVIW
jgi:hypothetical protein